MLTTLTPYWGRPEALKVLLKAIYNARHPHVNHLVLFVGEPLPRFDPPPRMRFVACERPRRGDIPSIGHYHNIGAHLADTEWIMKLDVDALPNQAYFRELLSVLCYAKPREWFNGGMLYVNRAASERFLNVNEDLVSSSLYQAVRRHFHLFSAASYKLPAATNFICRREDYLSLGGCDPAFRGYGWEDYQQIYMLEKYQRGEDPLPGKIETSNVALRCRNEISRKKATELFAKHSSLALLHAWHPVNQSPTYKTSAIMDRNRQTLLRYILNARSTPLAQCLLTT